MSERGYTIYAVDFDGTLCESVWPEIGAPNRHLIEYLKNRRELGDKIILWTCRAGERLREAVDWCRRYGLEFDAVNENLPEIAEEFGPTVKVFADCYIDDKNADRRRYGLPYRAGKLPPMNGWSRGGKRGLFRYEQNRH